MDLVVELLKLTAVGIISALFTSYISNRDHRHKNWWILKVNAYKETIESLSDLFHYFNTYYDAELLRNNVSVQKMNELHEIWTNGFSKVRKAADSGAFLFSSEVETALKNFVSAMNKDYDSRFEELDTGYSEVKKCLEFIVKASKKDLQLKASIIDRFN